MSEAMPFCWIRESKATEMRSGPAAVWSSMLWTEPAHAAGLVPLFAKPPESESPQWTKEPPIAPGHYWVWQPAEDWPCHGKPMTAIVEVSVRSEDRPLSVCVPKMEFGLPISSPDGCIGFWQSALWLGPIAAPAPPTKEQL